MLEDTYRSTDKDSKFKLLWYGGLNEKTVRNMTGTSKKEVCLEVGRQNVKAFETLLADFNSQCKIIITLKMGDDVIQLNEIESAWLMNSISAMKLTIQGGAWSEVGKMVESSLLYSIFTLLGVPEGNFIIKLDEIAKRCKIENREIDCAIIDSKGKCMTVEVKLLGIGNPEIGDEALARGVDLFLTDRMTEMMVQEGNKRGVRTIEFRQKNALEEIYKFLKSRDVPCKRPLKLTPEEYDGKIKTIVENYLSNAWSIQNL